jgi:YVTN family beta-propeller protein
MTSVMHSRAVSWFVAFVISGIGLSVAYAAVSTRPTRPDGVTTVPLSGRPQAVAVDEHTDTAYVTEWSGGADSGSVAVVSLATAKVTATIPVGIRPTGIAVDPATDFIYVANFGSASISVIDGAANIVTNTISASGSSWWPAPRQAVAVDPRTDTIYIAVNRDDVDAEVLVIDGNTDSITGEITGSGHASGGVVVNPLTDTVYTVYYDTPGVPDSAQFINGATGSVTTTISLRDPVFSVAADPDSGTFDVQGGPTLSFYNGKTGALEGSIPGLTASGMAVDTTTHTVAAATVTSIALINDESDRIVSRVPVFSLAIATDPVTDTLVGTGSFSVLLVALHPPAITSDDHTTMAVGHLGEFTVRATGFPIPDFTETGALPSGVKLSSAGVLRGTPGRGTGGVYRLTITASNGVPPEIRQVFELTIDQSPEVTSPDHVSFKSGRHNTFTIRTSGYPVAAVTEKGKLPHWLRFEPRKDGTALITGEPPRGEHRRITIQINASNGIGRSAAQRLTLRTR